MWIDLSEWAGSIKILISHLIAQQKVTSVQEEFNNKMGMVISQLLSPDTPVIAQWAHEQSDHGGRDGLSDMDFQSLRPVWV